ncbi:MAG: hypothetical protein H6625_12620 [Bdellovibrionaceae bacterium]|nr:hypothetical protein [Pseudobdellovibrionaceae bacterium]
MADETLQKNEPVDIESIKVSILLIVKNKSQFGSIIQFLNRREWQCTVVTTMNEAITSLSRDQPDFVFISFNHPNPKMMRLPGVLSQAFNAECVGFCETPDLKTESRLTASRIKYKLVGAASGPSIHRRVKQILSEIYGVADSENKDRVSSLYDDQNQNSITTVKGADKKSNTIQIKTEPHEMGPSSRKGLAYIPNSQKKKSKDQSELMKRLQSALSENEDNESQDAEADNAEENMASTLNKNKNKEDNIQQEKTANSEGTGLHKGESENTELNLQKGQRDTGGSLILEGQDSKRNSKIMDGDSQKTKNYHNRPEELDLNNNKTFDTDELTKNGVKNENQYNQENKEKISTVNKSKENIISEKNILPEEQSFLQKAIIKATDQLESSEKFENLDLKRTKVLGALPISGEGLNGYILVCSTVLENVSLKQLTKFKEFLDIEFKKLGKKINLYSELLINTIEVDAIDWTEQRAEYNLEKEFGKGYLIISFMKTEYKVPKLELDKEKNKLVIPHESIVASSELNFNAYIYLDKNKKFITYGKKGRSLSKKQIENLISNKKTLYINQQAEKEFKQYFSTGVVNDLIESYLKKDEKKVS